MTDHPLTDAICEELADTEDRPYAFRYCRLTYIEMINMRAAADWQLEQVIEWIRRHPWVGSDCPIYDFEDEQDRSQLITDLRKAMRPTTTQEDTP